MSDVFTASAPSPDIFGVGRQATTDIRPDTSTEDDFQLDTSIGIQVDATTDIVTQSEEPQQDTYEDVGFFGEAVRTVGTAAEDLTNSLVALPYDIAEYAFDSEAEAPQFDFIEDPTTTAGNVIAVGLQFMVPYLGAAKLVSWAMKLSKLKNVKSLEFLRAPTTLKGRMGRGALLGAPVDFVAFSPNDQNLSAVIQEHPELQNPISELLAADSDDPAMVNRFRNTVEGMGLGVLADGVLHMLAKGVVPAIGKSAGAVDKKVFNSSVSEWVTSCRERINKALQSASNSTMGSQMMTDAFIKRGLESGVMSERQSRVLLNAAQEFDMSRADSIQMKKDILGKDFIALKPMADGTVEHIRIGEGLGSIIDDAQALIAKHGDDKAFEHWETYMRDRYVIQILEANKKLPKKKVVPLSSDDVALEKATLARLDTIENSLPYGKEIMELQERHTKFNERMLDVYGDSDMINAAGRAKLVDEHVFLYKDMDWDAFEKGGSLGSPRIRTSYRDTTRTARKSGEHRDDMELGHVGSITKNLYRGYATMIDAAVTNRVKVMHVRMAEEMGEDGKTWIREYHPKADGPKDKINNLQRIYVNGEGKDYIIEDTFLLESLKTLGPDAAKLWSGWFPRSMRTLKNTFTRGVTMNPVFWGYTNPIRDTMHAAIFGKGKQLPFINVAKGIKGTVVDPIRDSATKVSKFVNEDLGNKEWQRFSQGYGQYLRQGGTFGSHTFSGAEEAFESYGKYLSSLPDSAFNGHKPISMMGNGWDKAMDVADGLIGRTEHAARFQEYQSLMKQGYSARNAAYEARNVSVDFAKRGTNETIRNVMAMIPFANAQIQGLYRTGQVLGGGRLLGRELSRENSDHAKRAWARLTMYSLAAGIAIPAYHEAMGGKVSEVYHSLEDHVRRNNNVLVLPNPDDPDNPYVFTGPVPHEAAFFAGIMKEALFAAFDEDTMPFVQDYITGFLGNTTRANAVGGMMPQGPRALFELYTNKTHGDRSIVPDYMFDNEGMPEELKHTQYTSAWAIATSRSLKEMFGRSVSPMQLEYLINNTLGPIVKNTFDLVGEPLLRSAIGIPAPQSDTNAFEKMFLNKVVKTADEHRSIRQGTRFREEMKKVEFLQKYQNDLMNGLNSFTREQLTKMSEDEETQRLLSTYPQMSATLREIARLNGEIRMINAIDAPVSDDSVSKLDAINTITKKRNNLVKHTMEVYFKTINPPTKEGN